MRDPDGHLIEVGQTSAAFLEQQSALNQANGSE
jgi:hypothetical protein